MQQKSTQKILLFSVAAQKVEKIKALCKTLGISVQQVEKSDYGQKLGAIAGITGFKKDGSRYSGADFPAELLVFSGINSLQMDIFLAEYKKAGIEPIGCKAVVTPDNVFWSADKLFREQEEKEAELEDMRALRFEPEYYQDYTKMNALDQDIDDIHNEIAHLEKKWEELMEEM